LEPQVFINVGFGLASFFGGFILKTVWSEIKALQEAMTSLQSRINTDYVRRDDFRDHATRVESMLVRIDAKLDGKMDKA
jgi:hypothetical protein